MKEVNATDRRIGELVLNDPCSLFYRLAQELPGEQVIINFGREKLLVCQDSSSVQTILRDRPDNYVKNFGSFVSFFGKSRLTTDGDLWRKLQKIGQPLISRVKPGDVGQQTCLFYGHAAAQLLAAAKNSPVVTIDGFIDHAAASVVMKTIFDLNISDLPTQFYDDLRILLSYCGKTSWNIQDTPYPMNPLERNEAERALGEVKTTILALIARGRSGNTAADPLLNNFYSTFSSDLDLFGEFCTLFFAGFDTTSSTLCWALMLLAHQPALQDRLRQEVLQLPEDFDGKNTHAPTKLMSGFINETFRMFPAIPILSRVAVEKDSVAGTEVKAGQKILFSIIGLHHDSTFWKASSKMEIERFPDGDPQGEQRRHLLPFSVGQRACGGSKIALTEISVALAILLRHLRFEPVDQQPIKFKWGASMRRDGGVRLVVSKHDK